MRGAIRRALKNQQAAKRRKTALSAAKERVKEFCSEVDISYLSDHEIGSVWIRFSRMMSEHPALRAALLAAKRKDIKIKIGFSSTIIGETIYICYDDTPREIIKFLTGRKP